MTTNNTDLDRLLREVFALCESTEDAPEREAKNEHQAGFERGRRFEAKQIRKSIGIWFQDTFCGASHMGEPVIAAPSLSVTPELLCSLKQAADWSGHPAVNKAYELLSAQAGSKPDQETTPSLTVVDGPVGRVDGDGRVKWFAPIPEEGSFLFCRPQSAPQVVMMPSLDQWQSYVTVKEQSEEGWAEVARLASERDRLTLEVVALRGLAATCYAGLGGECDLPENWLDALSAAANGEPFSTEGLLPYTASKPPAQGVAPPELLEFVDAVEGAADEMAWAHGDHRAGCYRGGEEAERTCGISNLKRNVFHATLGALRAALAQAPAAEWQALHASTTHLDTNGLPVWNDDVSLSRPAAAQVPAAVPLTDEQIADACSDIYLSDHAGQRGSSSYDVAVARAIERAHGIGAMAAAKEQP